jgi:hypothetical protein
MYCVFGFSRSKLNRFAVIQPMTGTNQHARSRVEGGSIGLGKSISGAIICRRIIPWFIDIEQTFPLAAPAHKSRI